MNAIAMMTGQAYRAAFACMGRKDVRYYLNGIHINTEHGEIVATNGHIQYVNSVTLATNPGDPVIFDPVRIPAKAETVEVCRHDEKHVLVHVTGSKGTVTTHTCPIIDGRYPDYRAVTPKVGGTRAEVSFDVKYLARLKQIFSMRARFKWNTDDKAFACQITGKPDEGTVTLMSLREAT